jgi:hypothetical protein
MEEFLKQQREELLLKEAQGQDFYWPVDCHQQYMEINTTFPEGLEENKADLAFITSILESFSNPKSMPAPPFKMK